jgi:hypothetical protein
LQFGLGGFDSGADGEGELVQAGKAGGVGLGVHRCVLL